MTRAIEQTIGWRAIDTIAPEGGLVRTLLKVGWTLLEAKMAEENIANVKESDLRAFDHPKHFDEGIPPLHRYVDSSGRTVEIIGGSHAQR